MVIGRYTGQGPAAVKLTGMVGSEEREFVYELTFPAKTDGRQGVRRAPVGAAEGRLPARPDPRQRREEGTDRRGGGAGQEVRHRHAVHQLPRGAGRPDAGREPAGRRTAEATPESGCGCRTPGADGRASRPPAWRPAGRTAGHRPAPGAGRRRARRTPEGGRRSSPGSRPPRRAEGGKPGDGLGQGPRRRAGQGDSTKRRRTIDRRAARRSLRRGAEAGRRTQTKTCERRRVELARAARRGITRTGKLGVDLAVSVEQPPQPGAG